MGGQATCTLGQGTWSKTLSFSLNSCQSCPVLKCAFQTHVSIQSVEGGGLSCSGGNSTTQGAVRLHKLLQCRLTGSTKLHLLFVRFLLVCCLFVVCLLFVFLFVCCLYEQRAGMRDGLAVWLHHLCPTVSFSAKSREGRRLNLNLKLCQLKMSPMSFFLCSCFSFL